MVLREDSLAEGFPGGAIKPGRFHNLVGQSPPMREVYSLVRSLARVRTTALVTGQTGAGKELVARALHATGPRSDKPFVKLNCAGLPDSLLETELFGHARGAGGGGDAAGGFRSVGEGVLEQDAGGGAVGDEQTEFASDNPALRAGAGGQGVTMLQFVV
jgi:DNA-binding NtrC family response regulator